MISMKNKISNLKNYTVKNKDSESEAEKRCNFYYLENETFWKEFDVEGHYTLDEAFEIAKDQILKDLIRMALRESVRSLDLKSKHFHFIKDGETEDLRDYIFDLDILDENTELFKEFKKLLLDNFNDDMMWYYFRVDALKDAKIHDDGDKKTLYNHYFDSLEEFKSRKSFLQYSNTYNGDYERNSTNCVIYYNILQYGDYHCIDNSITRKDLFDFLKANNYYIYEEYLLSNVTLWEVFGYYFGKNNGLSELESISFGYSLAYFFCDGHVLTDIFKNSKTKEFVKVDKYFKESLIYKVVESIVFRKIEGDLTEHTREIFFTIFDIYKNRIQEFEKKTKRLEFRVSERQYKQFMELEGDSKSDKLDSLIDYPKEEIEESVLPDINLDNDSFEEWEENNGLKGRVFKKDDWFYTEIPDLKDKYGEDKEVIVVNEERGALSPEEQVLYDDYMEMREREMEEIRKDCEEYIRLENEKMMRDIAEDIEKEKEAEWNAFLKELEEDDEKEMEYLKKYNPEEYQKRIELSEKIANMTEEERREYIRNIFKPLRDKFSQNTDNVED